MASQTTPHLHSYFRSSCSARVRTAAHLKGIPLEYTYIHLLKDEQFQPDYLNRNPSASVPTLSLTDKAGNKINIRQSIAILEFFEEYYPDRTPLLPPPSDYIARAQVRDLVNIISNDVQPLTNTRILQRVKKINADSAAPWATEIISLGLQAYEKVAEKTAGEYSVGDALTMADVVLAPAVEGAIRFGVDLHPFPVVMRIYEKIRVLEAFRRGDWRHQEDTPEEFRIKENVHT